MPPVHFTVTQIRVAASCPRILYFDAEHTRRNGLQTPAVTRIWKSGAGGETTACGSLFHAAIEKFNAGAATDDAVRELLRTAESSVAIQQGLLNHIYWNHLNRDLLFEKTGPQQQAFMAVLRVYVGELADILAFARKLGRPLDELLGEMFGDRRRRVDVTFPVGPDAVPVHVTGILDYVFYDWRTAHHRILDYKLTTAKEPSNDLFQVCLYVLMHHIQHQTTPDAGVLYLHPTRELLEKKWEDIWAERDKVFNLLASMREWARFDEPSGQGIKPPGETLFCNSCKWSDECERRLGPKQQGTRLELSVASSPMAPVSPDLPGAPAAGVAAADLWIGRTVSGERPVGLAREALPTHVAVVGAAGSGKTWLAKVVAEEAILQGVPVLAVDPQGDLVQFLRPSDAGAFNEEEGRRYQAFHQRVEPRILTPGSSHGIRMSLSPIRLASAAEVVGETDPQRRAEELEGMLATVAGNLVSLAKSGGETDSQQTFVLHVLKRLTASGEARSLRLADVAAGVIDPDHLGIDDADRFVKKSERERLGRKLNNLLHGPSANLFTGGLALDVGQLWRPVTAGKVPLNVIYLNALHGDDQKQCFVAALAAEVYRWMVTSVHAAGRPSLLFYLDEARDYIPAGAAKPPAKMPLIRLFTQGRKYGVACLMCTQSPRSVDYNVFGNCSTKIIGRLESPQDSDRVAEWFAQQGAAPAWLKGRAGAQAGTFVARWPRMPAHLEGQTVMSRRLFTLHQGAWSPDRLEQEMRDDPIREALKARSLDSGK
jgi:hypothetical protein